MIEALRQKWDKLTANHNTSSTIWKIIINKYTQKNRHYHNLSHIANMLNQLKQLDRTNINDIEILKYSIWFHDIIYSPIKQNNEQKSADFAQKTLLKLNIDPKRITNCQKQILATQHHNTKNSQESNDTKLLIDFDLEVLSWEWKKYKTYTQAIRKEYWMYPSILYKRGRLKALKKFLERKTIYQTKQYQDQYETKARINIQKEITLLN